MTAARLPDPDALIVEQRKITDYLLSWTSPDGRSKAKFFTGYGFAPERWLVMAEALREHGRQREVVQDIATEYGRKYIVACTVATPDGRSPCVVSVWIAEAGRPPRLVTAYPKEASKDSE